MGSWRPALVGFYLGCIIIWLQTAVVGSDGGEVHACHGDTIEISCPLGERINILGDFYGLSSAQQCFYTESDLCVVPTYGHTSVTKQVCNGRTTCVFTVSDQRTCVNGDQKTTYQQIKYDCISESLLNNVCSDDQWSSPKGYLTTPKYPMYYPMDMNCKCVLSATGDETITVKTLEFRIHYQTPCRDYVTIATDSGRRETICGSLHRVFRGRSIVLNFHSAKNAFKGFLLSYEGVGDSSVRVQCSKHQFGAGPRTGAERSNQRKVKLQYTVHHEDHEHDSQPATEDHYWRPFRQQKPSTTQTPPKLQDGRRSGQSGRRYVQTNKATKTTTIESYEVFSPHPVDRPPLHYVSGCFGDIVHFQCGDGEIIRIVDDMYGRGESGRCSYSSGDCVVHPSGQASNVQQLCSSRQHCRNLIVTRLFCGEHVTSYQQITYECVPVQSNVNICEKLIMQSASGYIVSPNFPEPYPEMLSCDCALRASGSQIRLSVSHFSLHVSSPCTDWLDIQNLETPTTTRLCGRGHGSYTAEEFRLHFNTDHESGQTGFWIFYTGSNDTVVDLACNVPLNKYMTTAPTTLSSTTLTTSLITRAGRPVSYTRKSQARHNMDRARVPNPTRKSTTKHDVDKVRVRNGTRKSPTEHNADKVRAQSAMGNSPIKHNLGKVGGPNATTATSVEKFANMITEMTTPPTLVAEVERSRTPTIASVTLVTQAAVLMTEPSIQEPEEPRKVEPTLILFAGTSVNLGNADESQDPPHRDNSSVQTDLMKGTILVNNSTPKKTLLGITSEGKQEINRPRGIRRTTTPSIVLFRRTTAKPNPVTAAPTSIPTRRRPTMRVRPRPRTSPQTITTDASVTVRAAVTSSGRARVLFASKDFYLCILTIITTFMASTFLSRMC